MSLRIDDAGGDDPGKERGAVIIVVALLLGAGVLAGMLALVVDVGQAYVGHRDAENVADIVALSMAYECVRSSATCSSALTMRSKADSLATANATGKRVYSVVSELCGTLSGTCGSLSTKPYECKAPDANSKYVRVRMTGHSSLVGGNVPLLFAPAIGASDRTTVWGCAQAGWGQVGSAPIKVPIMFSICEYDRTSPVLSREWKTGTAACSVIDLDGKTQNGNFRGFLPVKRASTTTIPWFNAACTNAVAVTVGTALIREASDICTGGLSAVLATMLNTPTLVPVTTTLGAAAAVNVATFAQYTLRGYTIDGVKYGDTSIAWPTDCLSTGGTSTSGNKCIYGSYSKAVIPYQKIDYNVPNLGINTVVALP